ncbi:DctP family TRAP transporter solute-binding subunit [Candidatus Atribacteria bacterium 1244-E10-H5-B2]|nr:MAG: DctP family TRAP transporter solute-binding subunit [Candidatus Atribacteria bacterium 1244-E10-H5-B2]
MKRIFLVCLITLMAVSLLGSFVFASPKYVLKLGHVAEPAKPYAQGGVKFAELVYEKTNGEVEIQIFPGSQLGNQRDLVEGLTFGTVDLTLTSTAVLANFLPKMAIFDLPFIFRDIPHTYRALDTIGVEMGKDLEPLGLKLLAFFENGVRHLTNSRRAVRVPEDMKGLKIRVMEQPVYIEMMNALGANPTPMAFGELFTALQQGTVDGQENPVSHIWTKRFFEVQKYISLTGHTYSAEPLLISTISWNKLPVDFQKAITDSAIEALDWHRSQCVELDKSFWKNIIESGKCEIIEVDKEPFREATAGVWKMFEDQVGKENIDKIVDIKPEDCVEYEKYL